MLVPIRKKWKKMLWGKVDQSSSVQKNQVEITWYNSRSWWATDAGGLTGSRSLKPCPSPCWTGDGRPHSYQCNSTVKGEKPLRMRQRMSVRHRQSCQRRADVAFLSIHCTFYESPFHCKVITTAPPPPPPPLLTGIIVQEHTEIRFLLSTLSRGSWNSVNSQHEDGYQQWKERSPWFCCHSEHLIIRGGN